MEEQGGWQNALPDLNMHSNLRWYLQVHLCEAKGMKDFMKDNGSDIGDEPILVAVKILREDATKNARYARDTIMVQKI